MKKRPGLAQFFLKNNALTTYGRDGAGTRHRSDKLTHFVSCSITVQLTSCLTGLDLTKQLNLFVIQDMQSS